MMLRSCCLRCFGWRNGDALLWHTDLKPHASGEFSIAVVPANSNLEDQSQVYTSPSATYVGVYDGHGGPEASSFDNRHLFLYLHNISSGENGCLLWFGDLLDIREVSPGQEIYIRIASSELGSGGKTRKTLIITLSLVAGVLLLFLVVYSRRRKKSARLLQETDSPTGKRRVYAQDRKGTPKKKIVVLVLASSKIWASQLMMLRLFHLGVTLHSHR